MKRVSGLSPGEVCRHHVTDDGSYDFELVGYRFPNPLSAEVKAELRALADTGNQPGRREDVIDGLKAVSLTMPHQGDVSDSKVWMETVWMAVEEYPADVINESLRKILKREKWRPTPAEIREECFVVSKRRRAFLKLSCPPANSSGSQP